MVNIYFAVKAILAIILISACSSFTDESKKEQTYQLLAHGDTFSFQIKYLPDNTAIITSSISLEKTKLKLSQSTEHHKVLEGTTDELGKSWHHAQIEGLEFSRIYIAPYYGLYSYYNLSNLKSFEDGIFYPDCPLHTKYLMVVYYNRPYVPIFGCIF